MGHECPVSAGRTRVRDGRRGRVSGTREARVRTDRGPAGRLRGRLRRPPGRRGGRRRDAASRARLAGAAPSPRHPVQEPRAGDAPPRGAHARPRPGPGSAGPGLVRRDAAEGDRTSTRCAAFARASSTALEGPHGPLRFEIQIETPQAVLVADGDGDRRADDPGRRRRVTGCTTAPTTTARRCGIAPAYQSPRPSRRRPREGGPAGGGGRHRRATCATGRRTSLPVGPRDRARRAAARTARAPLAATAATTRAGTCTRLQLVTRYAATYAFYRAAMPAAC